MTNKNTLIQRLELGTTSGEGRGTLEGNTLDATNVDHAQVNVVESLIIQASAKTTKADMMTKHEPMLAQLRSTMEESDKNGTTEKSKNSDTTGESEDNGTTDNELNQNPKSGALRDPDYFSNDLMLHIEQNNPTGRTIPKRYFTAVPYPKPENVSRKRQNSSDVGTGKGDIENKKPKTAHLLTPSMRLNEICSGLVFKYSDLIGQPHQPTFDVSVVYPQNGKEYNGTGRSKKLAKQNVAEKILNDIGHALPQRPMEEGSELEGDKEIIPGDVKSKSQPKKLLAGAVNDSTVADFIPQPKPAMDFTSDEFTLAMPGNSKSTASQEYFSDPSYVSPELFKRIGKTNIVSHSANALNCLLGVDGEIRYEFLPEDKGRASNEHHFQVKLEFKVPAWITKNQGNQADTKDRSFLGAGVSKKKAKSEAARLGLISILGISYFSAFVDYQAKNAGNMPKNIPRKQHNTSVSEAPVSETESTIIEETVDPEAHEYSLVFAQEVARLVTAKYAEIVKNDEKCAPQKVLAGVVMTFGSPLLRNMQVVCVSTGTKCIEGDYLSEKGLALNDCHAEILATRCLRDFLYSQIDALRNMENSSDKLEAADQIVLEKLDSIDDIMRFKLSEGVKFHLYISTSPCGDARIFSPKGVDVKDEIKPPPPPPTPSVPDEGVADIHPNRNSRGLLRAKIEAGEGTLPVSNLRAAHGSQTWDGIMMGNAVHTMSCSDKILRWNLLGVQGALLSLFMDPIYYSSIVLGSLHHPIHLKRAVVDRIQPLDQLIELPFRVNKPRLLMVADKGKRRVKKSPGHSTIWTCSWNSHEVISSAKGRCEPEGVASRLAKRLAFMRFLRIYKNKSGWKENFQTISYADAKKLATAYQESKAKFMALMSETGYGVWISKPMEQDAFFL